MNSITDLSAAMTGVSGSDSGQPADRAAEAAREFEALFVSMLIKEMRQSTSEDGMFAGDASDTFGGLFDSFMGEHIAAGGGIGLNQLFDSSLTGHPPNQELHAALEAARTQQALEAYSHGSSISTP